jgi:pyruvate-formate lyase-activating enzyme
MHEDQPQLLVANKKGEILDHPDYGAAGMIADDFGPIAVEDLIPLPYGSQFYYFPKAKPIGLDEAGKLTVINNYLPVAAFLPPGYTRTVLPAYVESEGSPLLPLWSYTAVVWYREQFYAAATEVAWMKKADPKLHDDAKLVPLVQKTLKKYPNNRLFEQLSRCALSYDCFAAKNVFFQRWEAPLPTAPACPSRCLGCLSLQEGECCASQERITFVPTPEEIAEVSLRHLKAADDAILSFGQGCEGEPLTQANTIARAIGMIREQTDRGVINLNSNGYAPEKVAMLAKAGLESIRISVNSFSEEYYNAYYRPHNYRFSEVMESIDVAFKERLFTTLNLLVFPGYTDREEEIEALVRQLSKTPVHLIQMRNLSIDPYFYMRSVKKPRGVAVGIRQFMNILKGHFPDLRFGYFNLPRTEIGPDPRLKLNSR